jgi:hypothetical protein
MRPVGIIILAFVIAVSGFFVWDAWRNSGPRIPQEARILINPNVEEAKKVLPHTIDDRTFFEESLDYLVEGAPSPKIVQMVQAGRPARKPVPAVVPKDVNNQPYQIFRNWTGAVLVPDLKVVSKAYTDLVTLARVEAHPIDDGRIRVWARVQNLTDEPLLLQQDCTFQIAGSAGIEKPYFESLEVPAADFRDVMFESDTKGVVAYTILVRLYQNDIW